MTVRVSPAKHVSATEAQVALCCPSGSPEEPCSIGPFVLVAHVLPLTVAPFELPPKFDVRPHPHIGLAALTYVLRGHVTHRDCLGSCAEVGPGGANFMVAGRGMVHSERFERLRVLGGELELFQVLIALPDGHEGAASRFIPVSPDAMVRHEERGVRWTTVVDTVAPPRSVIEFPAPLFFYDVSLEAGASFEPPRQLGENALYVIEGELELEGQIVPLLHRAEFGAESGIGAIKATQNSRFLFFGGEPVGRRYMWWNYVHSDLTEIERAKAAWRAEEVKLPAGDEESFTPAPSDDGRPLRVMNAESRVEPSSASAFKLA